MFIENQSGFTLVEVMVTLIIMSMLIGVIGSFLVMHVKSYETTKSIIDIQYEAQLALNRFGKVAMESAGVYNVDDTLNPKAIVFQYDDDEHSQNEKIIFLYERNKIFFKQLDKAVIEASDFIYNSDELNKTWYVFADYVNNWSLTPSNGTTFQESNGINFSMEFKKNDAIITVSNTFKYRNKY